MPHALYGEVFACCGLQPPPIDGISVRHNTNNTSPKPGPTDLTTSKSVRTACIPLHSREAGMKRLESPSLE